MLQMDYHCRQWMENMGFAQKRQKGATFEDKPLNHEIKTEKDEDAFLLEAEEGEQAGSTPSWIKTINYMAP